MVFNRSSETRALCVETIEMYFIVYLAEQRFQSLTRGLNCRVPQTVFLLATDRREGPSEETWGLSKTNNK